MRAFGVRKDASIFGIDPTDANENSELDYLGPGVTPLAIVAARRAA